MTARYNSWERDINVEAGGIKPDAIKHSFMKPNHGNS
jgi:hypothetical protein